MRIDLIYSFGRLMVDSRVEVTLIGTLLFHNDIDENVESTS